MNPVFKAALEYAQDSVTYQQECCKRILTASARFDNVDLSAVSYVYVRDYGVEFVLAKPDSRLAHTLARKFHVPFAKSKSYDEKSLVYEAKLKDGTEVRITGAVPPTCHVEYETVEVPATTYTVAKIVCSDEKQPRTPVDDGGIARDLFAPGF